MRGSHLDYAEEKWRRAIETDDLWRQIVEERLIAIEAALQRIEAALVKPTE